MSSLPRLLLAGPSSGSGKTTVAMVLLAGLRALGVRVQPFKVGPDYIDPVHLSAAAGRRAWNLDGFFLELPELLALFRWGARGADLALLEGVMGLFDGRDPLGQEGSTAQVAKLLQTPVVLVVNAEAMAGSVAALARGFRDHDPGLPFAGVIANRVASERHAALLREALDSAGIPFFGYLPRAPGLTLPERHLGLTLEATLRPEDLLPYARTLDLEGLLQVAQKAPPLPHLPHRLPLEAKPPRAAIALAQDEAFSFYYPEALDLLQLLGAELIPFSPLEDPDLPPGVGALWLGGGYPELYAEALAQNRAMRKALRAFKGPIYAECGGYIYLSEALVTPEGRFPMVGLVPGEVRMGERPLLGYRVVEALRDSPVARRGWVLKGHEFHYTTRPPSPSPAWRRAGGEEKEGHTDGRVLASFVHLYFPAHPEAARRFLAQARRKG